MNTLADFPIVRQWPARHPQVLQLHSAPTSNGVKVSVMLEETGLPYEPHFVDLSSLPAGSKLRQKQIMRACRRM
jgi:GST-like protein